MFCLCDSIVLTEDLIWEGYDPLVLGIISKYFLKKRLYKNFSWLDLKGGICGQIGAYVLYSVVGAHSRELEFVQPHHVWDQTVKREAATHRPAQVIVISLTY